MEYTAKLLYQSNYWYNDGLKKATIRDLSGAVKSLRRSLQYNRGNIAARNLLGLVYYGRGDIIEALVEWILSKNFQSHDNIANYYIRKMQEVPGELEQLDQCAKKYNQSLEFAKQNNEDMAIIQLKKALAIHPNYVKAYQLLALLYIKEEQYSQARQALRAAHKLDTTDEVTLRYMHEVTQARKERPVRVKDRGQDRSEQAIAYQIGNETIIQPGSAVFREGLGKRTLIHIGIGVLIGVAVMWFLVIPARDSRKQKDLNSQTVDFSDKIAMQEAQISALKTELETYRTTSEESENTQVTAEATQTSYEALMNVYQHFMDGDMSDKDMLEEMLQITPDSLGERGKDRYDTVAEELFPRMCEEYYDTAQEDMEEEDYDSAAASLEQVMQMDETYKDGAAMLLLAQCYERQGEQDQANVLYQSLVETYKDETVGKTAKKALEAQNGESAGSGTDSSGSGDGSGGSEEEDAGDT